MKTQLVLLLFFISFAINGQNSFPIYSSGANSGGSGDYTNVTTPQLKLQASSGFIRVPHISASGGVSVVYNFETGKNAYWGEPTDAGQYLFRGRDLVVTEGRLAIGTTSPAASRQLHINSNSGANVRLQSQYAVWDIQSDAFTNGNFGILNYTSGTADLTKSFVINGSSGNFGIGISNPSYKFQVAGGAIALDDDQPLRGGGRWLISGNQTAVTVGTANPGLNLRFMSGADNPRIFVDGTTGNVGIGTTSPNQKLTVNGTIYGKEVKVDLSVPGPDYVFEENYKLPSLEEIKTYIDQHKHLPEVPSAKEMEANGINVGEMNMLLLKKVEEVMLHLIDLKKENELLKMQMKKMELEIDKLKK
jgi:hypothetical protein